MCAHRGRPWDIPKHGLWTRQIKMMGQRKSGGNTHISDLNCHVGATQGLFLWVHPCVSPHVLYFLLGINNCFITFHVVGKFFLQNWRTRVLVTDHWSSKLRSNCFSTVTRLISGWEAKTCSELCRTRTPIRLTWVWILTQPLTSSLSLELLV